MNQNSAFFDEIPVEVIVHILQYVSLLTMHSVVRTSKLLSNIAINHVGYVNKRKIVLKTPKKLKELFKTLPHLIHTNSITLRFSIKQKHLKYLQGVYNLKLKIKDLLKVDFTNLKIVNCINLFHCKNLTDDHLVQLAGVHKIILWNTNVTDKGVRALSGVHTIDLRNCINVTSDGIKALAGVHSIKLRGCSVTDNGVKALAGVHKILLDKCDVTDDGIKALVGVHTIRIYSCDSVTDDGIKALAGVHKIDLSMDHITDDGIKALSGVHTIRLQDCHSVTNDGIKALTGVNTIVVEYCIQVTEAGIKALEGVPSVTFFDEPVGGLLQRLLRKK